MTDEKVANARGEAAKLAAKWRREDEAQRKADMAELLGMESGAGCRAVMRLLDMCGVFARPPADATPDWRAYRDGARSVGVAVLGECHAADPAAVYAAMAARAEEIRRRDAEMARAKQALNIALGKGAEE